jgi:hypothetical protein
MPSTAISSSSLLTQPSYAAQLPLTHDLAHPLDANRLNVPRPPEEGMADTQPQGFFSLPYEIREMIYKLLLVSDQWIIAEERSIRSSNIGTLGRNKLYCYKLSKVWVGSPEIGWSAQFLRVCKFFHAEASEFLYGHNKFELPLVTLEKKFLPTIGPRNASFIRYMEIARTELGSFKAGFTILTVLKALPSLRCLYFTPVILDLCTNDCQYFCKHTPGQLKIVVLRFAHLVTTAHPHLKWLLEFKPDTYTSPNNVWYKLSDDGSDKHPTRPHEHPDYVHQLINPRPRLGYEVAGEVVDIEQQLTRVKVVGVTIYRHVRRRPTSLAERPPWRL